MGDKLDYEVPARVKSYPIVELRQYTLHTNKRDVLIDLFEREFIEPQWMVGMQVIGQFRDLDNPDRFVWLRGFPDMPSRAKSLEMFYNGNVWKKHRDAANATMLDSDNVLLLRIADENSAFHVTTQESADSGILTAMIFYPEHNSKRVAIERTLLQKIVAMGVMKIASFVTEESPNNFPRLPVREGENVFVCFVYFSDGSDCTEKSKEWQTEILREYSNEKRLPDVLRLSPTRRSLVPVVY